MRVRYLDAKIVERLAGRIKRSLIVPASNSLQPLTLQQQERKIERESAYLN